MSKLIFDTYEFIKRLTAAGMPLEQAETLSGLQAQLIDERLATKDDLAQLEVRVDEKFSHVHKDISELRKDIDTRFELASKDTDIKLSKLRDTLVAWVIGLFLAQTSLLVGLFKLLPTSSAAV
ncbi:CCDC90 family protein [Mycoavidus sp. HKI]|uniref:CCDC90 family protein n=1 Tax=Mycoavidus sp. HKI TaxID=2840467 RepID=UPI001CBE586A|nr:CCDC90 family protein [Mycoavidus sp. HKI]UAW63583.1 CCDC90 family protein [Mycoavidus sp. HKI]